jgi:hypothetical protein
LHRHLIADLIEYSKETIMNIQTNLRAGAGGASGVGKNQTTKTADVVVLTQAYYPPLVGRCAGI